MYRILTASFVLSLIVGCDTHSSPPANPPQARLPAPLTLPAISLTEARKGFKTHLVRKESDLEAAPIPPKQMLNLVKFPAPLGDNVAYLSPDPGDGKKHPAIIWVFGGFDNGIGDAAWKGGRPSNDQSASSFRSAGILMMYPSFRGGSGNPGHRESFMGEVDDLLAAADYLAKQPFVDSNRIYLGGHSTGGTMVLLAAELTNRFRAVFSLGPADEARGYGGESLAFDMTDARENDLRSPGKWLDSVKSPLFVFEGKEQGNTPALLRLSNIVSKPNLHFYLAAGKTHFSIIAPLTKLLADRVAKDTGQTCNINFTMEEINQLPDK